MNSRVYKQLKHNDHLAQFRAKAKSIKRLNLTLQEPAAASSSSSPEPEPQVVPSYNYVTVVVPDRVTPSFATVDLTQSQLSAILLY